MGLCYKKFQALFALNQKSTTMNHMTKKSFQLLHFVDLCGLIGRVVLQKISLEVYTLLSCTH